ncbi:MAG: 2-C-methyl-D-erythritol 4-phosphate cytidylyltransferase [Waddliaceae bacterium]|jgi:2-C-methyl-D-erythritol 4-phosphate cytidylyltransferase|nr:2-C-methyl-D-erythritol 4-phosphate cytidylyltransferase [Waddliaceae bacterium]MBT3579663.1 2-C-methyl-D-erythritol 4-phosphate cytidylyltransferase [Waddliaceae bacterium]MBT4445248.1 2-C-methyl-D-erythritol 4-phosphate cytidylyltransferase [Waddliaceae bacterium]MBT6928092.1 2-C-methyl-D-erythritol 4-phosphate cytidylyltransferase [Waddliaceae bacterium]MBT7264653.1 2-C-methyl-D-erythritol 4-phosphate cytidylyltransferase [Waddliaceae bacterium]
MTKKTSLIFLAGGVGNRMKASLPKQFLELSGRPLFSYSLDVFAAIDNIDDIIVVCAEEHRHNFDSYKTLSMSFALPGPRRQDSVYNGLCEVSSDSELVIIHDSARPFITEKMASEALVDGEEHGAAVVGVPVTYTVKRSNDEGFVAETLPREDIWEIQTPQVVKHDLLKKGFEKALAEDITVTDDVALVEILNLPVKLVMGSRDNIKVTTPEDIALAENILKQKT